MKYYLLILLITTQFLYSEYEVEKINDVNIKVYSITSGLNYIAVGTAKGVYRADTSNIDSWAKTAFYNNKVTMVRYVDGIFFAGVIEEIDLILIIEELILKNSFDLSSWETTYNKTFGSNSYFYASDMIHYDNKYFISLRGTDNSPGGYCYFYDILNQKWDEARDGALVTYEFFDLEIYQDEIFCGADYYVGASNSTDGSILIGTNFTTPVLTTDYNIYALENFNDKFLFAGGEDGDGKAVLFRTDSISKLTKNSGWDQISLSNPNERGITVLETVDSILFIGTKSGNIYYSNDDGTSFQRLEATFQFGTINDLHFHDSANALFIGADYGLFVIKFEEEIPEETYTITGNITECYGSAIEGVLVEAYALTKYIADTTTDSRGNFTLSNLPSTIANIKFKKRHYAEKVIPINGLSQDSTLTECISRNSIERFMVRGKIEDCDTKKGLQGVSIKVYNANNDSLKNNTQTDKDGNYDSIDLTLGQYYIVISKEEYDKLRYDFEIDSSDVTIDTCLSKLPDIKPIISGTVLDSITRKPLENVEVKFENSAGEEFSKTTDENGEYKDLNVQNIGTFNIIGDLKGYKYHYDTLDIIESELEYNFSLHKSNNLSITTLDDCDDQPQDSVQIKLSSEKFVEEIPLFYSNKSVEIRGDYKNVKVQAIHPDFDTLNTSIDISKDSNYVLELKRTTIWHTLNLAFIDGKATYNVNDTVKVNAFVTTDCENIKPNINDYDLKLYFNPYDLYLINKEFNLASPNSFIELSETDETLRFLVLLNNQDSTRVTFRGFKKEQNTVLEEKSEFIKLNLPFKINKKYNILEKVFPNPTQQNFEVKYSIHEAGIYKLFLTDITGREIIRFYKKEIFATEKLEKFNINLESGSYYLIIESDKYFDYQQIIVQ